MLSDLITSITLKIFAQGGVTPDEWFMWPFGRGYDEGFWPTIAKFLFVGVIFGFLCLFLRLLFGPGAPFRDKELDREAEEMRKRELEQLEKELGAGKITKEEFEWRKRHI